MSEDDGGGGAAKWACEYCTYENFRSALRCTMCGGGKPLFNEDIYRLGASAASSHPPPSLVAVDSDRPRSTTASKADRSKTPSPQPPPPQPINAAAPSTGATADALGCPSASSASEQDDVESAGNAANAERDRTYSLRSMAGIAAGAANSTNNRGSDTDLSVPLADRRRRPSNASLHIYSNTTSPLGSTTNLSGSRTNLGAAALRSSDANAANKWSCALCTYENYPKSRKCSMCGQPKDAGGEAAGKRTPDAGAAGPQSSPDRSDNSGDDDRAASNYIIPSTASSSAAAAAAAHRGSHRNNRYALMSGGASSAAAAVAAAAAGSDALLASACGSSAPMTASMANPANNNCDTVQERRFRHMRRQADWQWLHACLGVVENNYAAVEAYLSCGGNPGRSLTATEVTLLNRNSAFDVGHTLIHLAIRFHREEMLPMLLTQISGSGPGIKRVPSYVAPDLASDIRRHFAGSLRCRKASFPCPYVSEHATFALPAEIEELPHVIQEQLHDELFDRDAQAQLECKPFALNWSLEITVRLGSRLSVLWNRSAGDCLLDSAMQATWGVFDRDNVLRRALADSLHQCAHMFYARWKEYEMAQAALMEFSLEETQWQEDWATLQSLARQPGASLEQLHIFALAHILRRPIIVYGVKFVKSFRGEDIGFARFEGVYLPLMWEQSFCSKSPIALGYTRGHFSALVPKEPYTSRIDATCVDAESVLYLPLMDSVHKTLPIHFLTHAEMGHEESIMRQWMDVCYTEGNLLVAQQKLQKRPLLVAQMLEEWLNHYRRIAQMTSGPYNRRGARNHTGYSSDGDTDEE